MVVHVGAEMAPFFAATDTLLKSDGGIFFLSVGLVMFRRQPLLEAIPAAISSTSCNRTYIMR